jgi:uncharacterized protein YjbI with pentapeptide repeats
MRLISILRIAGLSLTFTVLITVAGLGQAPQDEKLTEAQIKNQDAQTAYYRKQLEEHSFWQTIGDNPAAMGAVIAAFVALISFIFNYRATLRNQIDTQFYEAMKRFGDKDSPMLRSSAAGILAQMGRSRTFTLRWQSPFFWRFPYFRTAFDQLITGHLVEQDHVALDSIKKALFELISVNRKLARERLSSANYSLENDLVRALTAFFVSRSAQTQIKTANPWEIEDIQDDLWHQAAFITTYKKKLLRDLAVINKDKFSDFINALLLAKELMTEIQKDENSMAALRTLQNVANRLEENGNMFGSSFRGKSRVLAFLSKMPQIGFIILSGLFRRKSLKRHELFLQPFFNKTLLSFIYLNGAWLHKAQLSEATLLEIQLINVTFEEAEMEETSFTDALIFNVNLSNSNLKKADFGTSKLMNVNFSGVDLQAAVFNRSLLYDIDFSRAGNLQSVGFSNSQLNKVNLSNVNLQRADFHFAKLSKVNLSTADLRETNFQFAELNEVNLAQANLQAALWYGAKIGSKTKLENVEWWKANFSIEGDKLTDLSLLEDLYQRFGKTIPKGINIDTDVHESLRDFLKSKISA